jgi:virginiamycin B lyase
MMQNFRVPIPADQVTPITNYLINAFPEPSRPQAVVIPGPTDVNIKEWPVPTPGSRPHDPLATRDAAIWYTGQLANVLGRLDSKSGQIKEYSLHRQQTAPTRYPVATAACSGRRTKAALIVIDLCRAYQRPQLPHTDA